MNDDAATVGRRSTYEKAKLAVYAAVLVGACLYVPGKLLVVRFTNRGTGLLDAGRPAEAARQYEKALRIWPWYGPARPLLLRAYDEAGDAADSRNDAAAVEMWCAKSRRAGDPSSADKKLAMLYTRLGKAEEALALWRAYAERRPDDFYARKMIAGVQRRVDRRRRETETGARVRLPAGVEILLSQVRFLPPWYSSTDGTRLLVSVRVTNDTTSGIALAPDDQFVLHVGPYELCPQPAAGSELDMPPVPSAGGASRLEACTLEPGRSVLGTITFELEHDARTSAGQGDVRLVWMGPVGKAELDLATVEARCLSLSTRDVLADWGGTVLAAEGRLNLLNYGVLDEELVAAVGRLSGKTVLDLSGLGTIGLCAVSDLLLVLREDARLSGNVVLMDTSGDTQRATSLLEQRRRGLRPGPAPGTEVFKNEPRAVVALAEQSATPVAELRRLLALAEPAIRSEAVTALARQRGDEAGELLGAAVSDPDAGVRVCALRVMVARDGIDVVSQLLAAAGDASAEVRCAALAGLGPEHPGYGAGGSWLRREAEHPETARGPPEPKLELPAARKDEVLGVLLRLAEDDSASVRHAAAQALAAYPDGPCVDALVVLLTDPAPAVRARAADSLGRQRTEVAVSDLAELARAPEQACQVSAVWALAAIATDAAEEALIALLDPRGETWALGNVAEALAFLRSRLAVPWLIDLLASDACAELAATALGEIGDEQAAGPVLAALRRYPGRPALIVAVGKLRATAAADLLVETYVDEGTSTAVKAAALGALGCLGDPRTVELAERALATPQPRGQEAPQPAADMTAGMGPETPAPVVAPGRLLRPAAIKALGEVGGARSVALLQEVVSDRAAERQHREEAVAALARIDAPEARAALRRIAGEALAPTPRDVHMAGSALRALGRLRDTEILDLAEELVAAPAGRTADAYLAAIEVLAQAEESRAIPLLQRVLERSPIDAAAVRAAITALAAMDTPEARQALERLRTREDFAGEAARGALTRVRGGR